MSFVLDSSSLRCRGVLNQLFVAASCELRHSVTLKAELRRSIEVVLAGHHFVADLSTWFREVTDLSAASFCFDDQSRADNLVLVKLGFSALSVPRFFGV